MTVTAALAALMTAGAAEQPGAQTSPAESEPAATEPIRLEPRMVTATREEEATFLLPYSASVIQSIDLERTLPRTTPDTLREVPSVMLQKTSHGQGSPYIRGFTGFRTLMLVDGIRLNNSTFRDGPNQYWGTVDALSLDRVEVVRGPGSVLYGSDAVGGTVNALTKSRQDYGPGTDWNGGLFYRFASAEESHIGRPEVSAQWEEKVGLHLGGSIKEFGDFHGGRDVGEQPNTGYSEWDIDGKLEYLVAPHSKFVFAHQTVNLDDAWRTHSTIYGVDWEGTRHGSDQVRKFDQSRTLDYLQFHAQELEGFAEEVHASVSHHYQGEMETRVRSSGVRERQGVDVNTLGLSLQLHSPSPVGRWIYGAEYYRDWVNSGFRRFDAEGNLEQERVQGPVADDATYDLAGVYLENHLPLFGDRLELILGGRYTYAGVDAQRIRDPLTGGTFSLTDSWDNAVGNGRLLYRVQPEHLSVFMGASQGFRAPNLSDLTRWDADWGQEIPTPGVDPELFLSLEIGARAQYGPLTAEAAYFYTFIDDLIVRVPTGELSPNGDIIVSKANSGRGFVQGVELAASIRVLRDWMLWGNGTWIDGEVDAPRTPGGPDVTEPISRLMPETLNAGLRWNHPKGRLWAEFATTVAGRADQLASNDLLDTQRIPPGGTPGYAVYHLRAGWSPWRQTSLTAALENITDEDYRIHGSGVNEPGRNFVIAAQVRF